MKILVCVKQVPDTTEIKIDPVTNTLIRAGVPSIVNPFDAFALETAVRIKEQYGGAVTVVSMGPEQAKAALKECLSLGADEAILISDRAFGGSDTLATSYVLASVIRKLGGFDLIFCGKQAIDGDTGQVGPEIAEHLDLAQITYVCNIEGIQDGKVIARRENETSYERVEAELPAVLTVIKTEYEPRYASIKSKMAAAKKEIPILKAGDLSVEEEKLGLKGSPTKVKKTFVPLRQKNGVKVKPESAQEAVDGLLGFLESMKVI